MNINCHDYEEVLGDGLYPQRETKIGSVKINAGYRTIFSGSGFHRVFFPDTYFFLKASTDLSDYKLRIAHVMDDNINAKSICLPNLNFYTNHKIPKVCLGDFLPRKQNFEEMFFDLINYFFLSKFSLKPTLLEKWKDKNNIEFIHSEMLKVVWDYNYNFELIDYVILYGIDVDKFKLLYNLK